MATYAIIMAGGVGTRFWPRSREKNPKQFLNIIGDQSLIQQTYHRILPLIPKENILFVINQIHFNPLKRQLPDIPEENILLEPIGKNTAPCIGLASLHIKRRDPNAVTIVLPSDHLIENEDLFLRVLRVGIAIAQEEDYLVTIGIQPTRPATGYGYIQLHRKIRELNGVSVYRVKTFAEKPNLATALEFLRSGDFLWNSGMFIWKVSTVLREIEEYLPELYNGLMTIEKHIGNEHYFSSVETVYRKTRSISIDYGIMEKSQRVCVIKGEFGWSDVGSWEEAYKFLPKDRHGNALVGQHVLKETQNCLIVSPDTLVATIGLQDLIIVKSQNALLICPKSKAQDVKEIVDILKKENLKEYL